MNDARKNGVIAIKLWRLEKQVEELEKEVEKLKHYKTLYQSLKRQKDEAVEYIKKELLCFDNESVEYIEGLKILKILEGVNDE